MSSRPGKDPIPLFGRQPFDLFGEVGDEEESGDADEDGQDAFENEEPSPVTQAANAAHVGDGAGEQAAESASDEDGAPEDGEAPLGFLPLVPETDDVEAWGRRDGVWSVGGLHVALGIGP